MFDFHYNYVMKKWGKDHASLLFTDTDSLTYCIETEDIYRDMIPDVKERFDTSKYPPNHPSGIESGVNMGAIGGIFKDEFASKAVKHFRGPNQSAIALWLEKRGNKAIKGCEKGCCCR